MLFVGVNILTKRGKQILLAVFLGAVLPTLLFSFWGRGLRQSVTETTQPPNPSTHLIATTDGDMLSTQPSEPISSMTISVLMRDGNVQQMSMDAYLTSVVLAEMYADFEMEALKAQAVVARTYTLYKLASPKHDVAAVCTDAGCCQGYCSLHEYLQAGGTQAQILRVQQAVEQTDMLVITYEGELIEATYFSCSGGKTEDALAVWGTDVPYLQSTDSPGEEGATYYTDTVAFDVSEFNRRLGNAMTGPSESWLEAVTYTKGGGVATMTLCGKTYLGTELRQLLGLRSTAFVLTAIGDTVIITTKGFGHRVGMSQYGAEAMAANGSDFRQILTHYYKSIAIEKYVQ